jgi:hypothetical protein
MRSSASRKWPAALFHLVAALLFFLAVLGPRPLLPTNIAWLMSDDRAFHYLGWAFFRSDAWHFPLTRIDTLLWPIGTTAVHTDAIPLLALPLKLLRALLPQPFQYFGLFLLLCWFLQAHIAFRLLRLLAVPLESALIGSLFFLCSTTLLWRLWHVALCAHFLILWSLHLYVRVHRGLARPLPELLLLLLCAAAVHPYLLFMALALSAAVALRGLDRRRLPALLGALLLLFGWLYVLGYFVIRSAGDKGFGGYAADLLTFVNSMGHARFLPRLPASPGAYEGYAYLGAGALGLLAVLLCRRPWRLFGPLRPHLPLLAVVAALAVLAVASKVRVAGETVLSLEGPYRLLGPLPSIVRASGRFIWPAYYLLLLFITVGITRAFRGRVAAALLLAGLVVQGIDLGPVMAQLRGVMRDQPWEVAELPAWLKAPPAGIRALHLVPPFVHSSIFYCGTGWTETPAVFYSAAHLAAVQGWRFNSGQSGRLDRALAREHCAREAQPPRTPAPDALYILRAPDARLHCTPFGDAVLCLSNRPP